MKNILKYLILEAITKSKVICDNCNWSWNIKDGGKDKYICHKCGHDNNPNLNEQVLNEKLAELDLDVNRLYNHFFKKDIDEIKRTNIVTTNMFKSNSYNTSMLIEPQSIEGDKLNHCEILINKKLYPNLSNFYKPSLNIISLSINFNAVNLALNYDGDINKAMQNLYPQKLQNSFLNEFSEEKIKGSINHELLHWLDDTFNNKHIYQKLHPKSKFKLKNPYVDATKMEIQAQLGNIKQLKNKYQNSWNDLTFLEFINLSPSLTNIYGKLPQKYKVNWIKNLLSRMNRENLLGDNMKKTLNEQEDYKGEHTAPSKAQGYSSIDDLYNAYGDDIYKPNAVQYYGDGYPYDNLAIEIMQKAKGKPNKPIKIYRAIPDFNYEIKEKIKELLKINQYYDKFNFFPLNNHIIENLQNKYPIEKYSYNEQTKLILQDIFKQVNELKNQLENNKITINNGDWVTTTLQYAKSHGKTQLNNKYKVISKVVPASTLYTDGNSIHEFGYNP